MRPYPDIIKNTPTIIAPNGTNSHFGGKFSLKLRWCRITNNANMPLLERTLSLLRTCNLISSFL